MTRIGTHKDPWRVSERPHFDFSNFHSVNDSHRHNPRHPPIIKLRIPTSDLSAQEEFSVVCETLRNLSDRPEVDHIFTTGRGQNSSNEGANNVLADATREAYRSLEEKRRRPQETTETIKGFLSATFPDGFSLPGVLNDASIVIDATGKMNKYRPFAAEGGKHDMDKLETFWKGEISHEPCTDHDHCSCKFKEAVQASRDKQTGVSKLLFDLHGETCSGRLHHFTLEECSDLVSEVSKLLNGDEEEVKQDLARLEGYTHEEIPESLQARFKGLFSTWIQNTDLKCYDLHRTSDRHLRYATDSDFRCMLTSQYLRNSAMTNNQVQEGALIKGNDLMDGRSVIRSAWSGCEESLDKQTKAVIRAAQSEARKALAEKLLRRYGDRPSNTFSTRPSNAQISDCLVESVRVIVNVLHYLHDPTEQRATVNLNIVSEDEVPENWRFNGYEAKPEEYVDIRAGWSQSESKSLRCAPYFVPIHASTLFSSAQADADAIHIEVEKMSDNQV